MVLHQQLLMMQIGNYVHAVCSKMTTIGKVQLHALNNSECGVVWCGVVCRVLLFIQDGVRLHFLFLQRCVCSRDWVRAEQHRFTHPLGGVHQPMVQQWSSSPYSSGSNVYEFCFWFHALVCGGNLTHCKLHVEMLKGLTMRLYNTACA